MSLKYGLKNRIKEDKIMILSQVDFTQYKPELEKHLKVNFSSSDIFENYVKEKFGTKNSRIFVANIARGILKNNHQEMDLDRFTDKELIVLINISKNKTKLLESKNDETLKVYLETINSHNLNLVSSLEKVFDDGKLEKLVLETKEQIETVDATKNKSSKLPYILFAMVVGVFILYTVFYDKKVKVVTYNEANTIKVAENNESNNSDDENITKVIDNNELNNSNEANITKVIDNNESNNSNEANITKVIDNNESNK